MGLSRTVSKINGENCYFSTLPVYLTLRLRGVPIGNFVTGVGLKNWNDVRTVQECKK